jgi:hypothetical protein
MAKDIHRVVGGYALSSFLVFETPTPDIEVFRNERRAKDLRHGYSAESGLDTHLAQEPRERCRHRVR